MAELSPEIGKIIKWTERENSFGQTEEFTKVPMLRTNNTDMENLFGQMAENTEEIGETANRTVKVSTLMHGKE